MNKNTKSILINIIKEELEGFLSEDSGHGQIKAKLHDLVALLVKIENMAEVSKYINQGAVADEIDDLIKELMSLSKTLRKGTIKKKKKVIAEPVDKDVDLDLN